MGLGRRVVVTFLSAKERIMYPLLTLLLCFEMARRALLENPQNIHKHSCVLCLEGAEKVQRKLHEKLKSMLNSDMLTE